MKTLSVFLISFLLQSLASGLPVKHQQLRDASLSTEESRSLTLVQKPVIRNGDPAVKISRGSLLDYVAGSKKPRVVKTFVVRTDGGVAEADDLVFYNDAEDSPRGGWKRIPGGVGSGGTGRTANDPVPSRAKSLKQKRSINPGGDGGPDRFTNDIMTGLKQRRSVSPGGDKGRGYTNSPAIALKDRLRRSAIPRGDESLDTMFSPNTGGEHISASKKRSAIPRGSEPSGIMFSPNTGGEETS